MQDPTAAPGPAPAAAPAYVLRELAVPVADREPDLALEVARFLRLKRSRIGAVRILRKSLDSRRRNQPLWRYTLEFRFDGPLRHPRVTVRAGPAPREAEPVARRRPPGPRVAVIGCGPAGMAAALGLSRKGYAVEVFEQGGDVGRRFRDIRRFLKGNAFNPRSNILFPSSSPAAPIPGSPTCPIPISAPTSCNSSSSPCASAARPWARASASTPSSRTS
jgi:hypothetical protein